MAPEVLRGEEYGRAVDMWGIGVLLFILLRGRLPFTGSEEQLVEAAMNGCYNVSHGSLLNGESEIGL